jgi:hypothetical protein
MTLDQLTELFKWMTILNIAIFITSALLGMALRQLVCRMHGRMFGIDEAQVSVVLYGYLGVLRIFVIVFSIVPYLSLLILRQ